MKKPLNKDCIHFKTPMSPTKKKQGIGFCDRWEGYCTGYVTLPCCTPNIVRPKDPHE